MHNQKNIFLKAIDWYKGFVFIGMSLQAKNQDRQASAEQTGQIYMNPGQLAQSHCFHLPFLHPTFFFNVLYSKDDYRIKYLLI